ncbi:MAG TPA: hypothetical protein VNU97_15795 [Rhizomicrobium sp.]|jgi:hypothetical protein|nr:hypothetical protein [Rhizomicrobium sp.]
MRLSALIRLWLWLTLLAVAAFAVLAVLDGRLKAATGFGTLDLQGAQSALDYKRVFAAWIARQHAATAGFSLGFDYLFMPLYAVSFYFSAMLAREAFTPKRGLARRTLDYLGFVPLAGALADAIENGLEFSMLSGAPDDATARFAYMASNVKTTCFYVGLALLLGGIAGAIKLRRKKKDESPAR